VIKIDSPGAARPQDGYLKILHGKFGRQVDGAQPNATRIASLLRGALSAASGRRWQRFCVNIERFTVGEWQAMPG
jgi:hypothetical protein